ncbi:MAG: restriction endonuclease subunit S [Acetobacteraceae bacterium]|jgi:type I restriction enzyme S subunit
MMEVYRFKKLDRWDKFTIPHLHFPSRVSSARIGDLLRPRNETVDRSKHSFADLQPITIHFDGNISRRSVKDSRDYTMALKWVRPNDLVLSKIDLKNGAVGILPADWSNAVVTTHFAVYEPDTTRVYPLYLRYLVQTSEFKSWLWANRSGADGRTEVKLPVFEDLEIPLPDLAEQQANVAAYDAALKEAAAKEQAAEAAEAKAMADFEAALGFAPPLPLPDKPIFVASFKDLDRWSHEGVLRRITGGATGTSAWPVVRLGDVIADLENGWSPKCLDRPAEPGEWGVLKVSAASAGRYRGGENKALPASLQPRPRLEVRAGDVLITRANGVAKLVGVSAYVEQTQSNLLICDKLFRAVFRPKSAIEPRFMAMVLRLHPIRAQIVREFSTESGMMKNVSKPVLLSLTFPLPPLEDQRALIKALNAERAEASRLRTEAAAVRVNAWAAFEAAVYAADAKTSVAAPNPTNEALAEALA